MVRLVKKIGLITLQGNFNYGNRLQNFALEQVLIALGYDVNTLDFPIKKKRENRYSLKRALKAVVYHFSKKRISHLKMIQEKTKLLLPFTENHIHLVSLDTINVSDYDAFFVGSDQVWNPGYIGDDTRFFLDFAPQSKRFSYAASFGLSNLPVEYKNKYKISLNEMNKISVREEAGVQIVRDLNSQATLVADPTLLLTRDEWLKKAESANFSNLNKFVLVYMLGGSNSEYMAVIESYAKENGLDVITIMGEEYNSKEWIPTPFEFISAINQAEAVFTDSFHCTLFSIVFNTPFLVFNRSGAQMFSRIDTLLSIFTLEKNKFDSKLSIAEVLKNTDFSIVDRVMNEQRKHGIRFITDCLNN